MQDARYIADVLAGKRQWTVLAGDCRDLLKLLPDESVQCVVTSPPYWGLRDYGVAGQVGLEPSPQEYVAQMVEIFREVRRVLRSDGTCWLNLGDTYFGSGGAGGDYAEGGLKAGQPKYKQRVVNGATKQATNANADFSAPHRSRKIENLKPKDLIGVPWEVALALRNDGWWLRSDIVWAKPNPMPESVTDRPARSHEYIFLLTKSGRYYYDYDAVRRPMAESSIPRLEQDIEHQNGSARAYGGLKVMKAVQRKTDKQRGHSRKHAGFNERWDAMTHEEQTALGANLRDVWNVATHAFSEAHFATFPPKLIEPCIKAGSKPGDVVLDPFNGAGTTGLVATRLDRRYIGLELNPDYAVMARNRIYGDAPLLQEPEPCG